MPHLSSDAAQSTKELTQFLLSGSNSLTAAERELIAAVVVQGSYCWLWDAGSVTVSEKMKALLTIAVAVREGGMAVIPELMDQAFAAGATEVEIHDTVLLAVLLVEPVA